MTYENGLSGRMETQASIRGRERFGPGFLSAADVEERLVEAMCLWRRAPDRERGWLNVRAYWPDIRRAEFIRIVGNELDWPEEKPEARTPPLSRAEVAAMTEASDWLALVDERDRKLVALAVSYLAKGHARVPWLRIKRLVGVAFGADGLRKRYGRALTAIANEVNRRKSA